MGESLLIGSPTLFITSVPSYCGFQSGFRFRSSPNKFGSHSTISTSRWFKMMSVLTTTWRFMNRMSARPNTGNYWGGDIIASFPFFIHSTVEYNKAFRFCGTMLPPTLLSSSYKMAVVFSSDRSIAGNGFSARYHFPFTREDLLSP